MELFAIVFSFCVCDILFSDQFSFVTLSSFRTVWNFLLLFLVLLSLHLSLKKIYKFCHFIEKIMILRNIQILRNGKAVRGTVLYFEAGGGENSLKIWLNFVTLFMDVSTIFCLLGERCHLCPYFTLSHITFYTLITIQISVNSAKFDNDISYDSYF